MNNVISNANKESLISQTLSTAIKVHLQSMTGRGETNVDQHNFNESRPGQILVF